MSTRLALVVVVALTAAALTAAAQPALAANSAQWSDPRGDGDSGLAPDITTVTVSNTDNGLLTIRAEMPLDRYLLEGTTVFVDFDTDQNPGTGAARGGEYAILIDGDADTASLAWWDGERLRLRDSSLRWWWDSGPTIEINAREIGSPRGFNLSITAWWEGGSGTSYWDFAPDIGRGPWSYQIRGAPPPPPPPEPPPPPPEPEPDVLVRPTAGGKWAYTAPAVVYSGGRVAVHYVTAGQDAPPASDTDQDGTPDYVEEIAEAADAALEQFERLGFKAPLPDTGGPDGRPDLYVKHPGEDGWLGLAVAYRYAEGGSFLLIHPGLDTATDVLEDVSLRTTVAHELFHLVQYAYTPGGELPRWIAEGTASAAEAFAYPEVDETIWFLFVGSWLGETWRPLHDEEFHCDRCYGGALWWLMLHQDDPGLLPAYFDRLGLLARLDRPYGVGTGVLNTIIGQRANIARTAPGPGGRLPISVGEFDSLHEALAEFAEGIYREGLRPGALRQVKPRKKQRTIRSVQLAGFSIHYLPVRVHPGARQLKITVKATGRQTPDVRLLIGGPNGRTITPPTTGTRQTLTARLRNRKQRRTIILIITSGHRTPTTYQITHRAK